MKLASQKLGTAAPARGAFRHACVVATLLAARATWGSELLAQTEPAHADASVVLFREGRQLLGEGRIAEACTKFRASLRLHRSPGTLLNIGNCLIAEGRLVDALSTFEESLHLAEQEPDAMKANAWSDAARHEITKLEARIARLVVSVPATGDVRLTIDGEPTPRSDQPLRLDPGRHRIQASAAGKQPFERDIELAEGELLRLDIPVLEAADPKALDRDQAESTVAAPPPSNPATNSTTGGDGGTPRREAVAPEGAGAAPSTLPQWALIAGGGAVFLGGAITGLFAIQMESDLKTTCPDKRCEGDLSEPERAQRTALVADVLMATGIAAAAVGGAWLLLGEDEPSTTLEAGCGLRGCAASVSGRF